MARLILAVLSEATILAAALPRLAGIILGEIARLLPSTAVDQVATAWGTPAQKWIDRMSVEDAERLLAEGAHFARGRSS